MRKAMLVGAATWLAMSAQARAQQASLFTGSFTNTKVQYVTVVDKAPLVAPIPNQTPKATIFDKVVKRLNRFFHPTLGSNPVATVTTPTLSSPVTPTTFSPQAPFFNGQ